MTDSEEESKEELDSETDLEDIENLPELETTKRTKRTWIKNNGTITINDKTTNFISTKTSW